MRHLVQYNKFLGTLAAMYLVQHQCFLRTSNAFLQSWCCSIFTDWHGFFSRSKNDFQTSSALDVFSLKLEFPSMKAWISLHESLDFLILYKLDPFLEKLIQFLS